MGTTSNYMTINSPKILMRGRQTADSEPLESRFARAPQRAFSKLHTRRTHVRECNEMSQLTDIVKTDFICSTLINYLHDFYMHSFMTAKYWGRVRGYGPQGRYLP